MSKTIFTKDEAENLAVSYHPKKFPHLVTQAATEFIHRQTNGSTAFGASSGFRLDPIVSAQAGVAELERVSMDARIEQSALERVKILQEDAYSQAFEVGKEEGRESAFNEYRTQFEDKINQLEQILVSISNLKTELVNSNETQIVSLVYYLATKLAADEIEKRPEVILTVLNQAIAGTQQEENISVRVSPSDFDFIESIRDKIGKEFAFITSKTIKFEASDEIQSGGCIVRTNYGEVNATIEQRVAKLWKAISEKFPKVKDSVGE